MRVIVVEDNVLFCNYICNFLQKADLDTVRTYRLAQAKKIIGTSIREDDIVLADLRLPDGESYHAVAVDEGERLYAPVHHDD